MVRITMEDGGIIDIELNEEVAPITCENFKKLVSEGFYNGLTFHRVIPDFVIQGGCPNTRDMTCEQVAAGQAGPDGQPGTGGPGWCIQEEFSTNPRNSHEDGALAMARSMDPNSAGSQFYFCLGPQHNLDSGYTVFGATVEGKDVIGALRAGDEIVKVDIVHGA